MVLKKKKKDTNVCDDPTQEVGKIRKNKITGEYQRLLYIYVTTVGHSYSETTGYDLEQ